MSKTYDLKSCGGDILSKVHERGWNPYKSTDVSSLGADGTIRRGPASELEVGERYVMLPKVKDDKDPRAVFGELERVARSQLGRQPPTIEIDGERFPWTGFIPRKRDVKINSEIGHYLSYQDFLRALDTIHQIV